jgi:hypothetical protein
MAAIWAPFLVGLCSRACEQEALAGWGDGGLNILVLPTFSFFPPADAEHQRSTATPTANGSVKASANPSNGVSGRATMGAFEAMSRAQGAVFHQRLRQTGLSAPRHPLNLPLALAACAHNGAIAPAP